MTRAVRLALATAVFAGAALLALYGLFAIAYTGDGGDTYGELNGRVVDADLVGAIALALAAAAVGLGTVLGRSSRSSADAASSVER